MCWCVAVTEMNNVLIDFGSFLHQHRDSAIPEAEHISCATEHCLGHVWNPSIRNGHTRLYGVLPQPFCLLLCTSFHHPQ